MFRKSTLLSFFTIALMLGGASAALAQTAPVRGVVEMNGADGKPVPVAGAVVDCYRVDINGKFPSSKTDKKGNFTFAGLPLGATFVLAISGPGISPAVYPNVKAGREDIVVVVSSGDGKVFTEAEVRDSLKRGATNAATPTAEMTAEQKKAAAEYEAKVKEVESKNNKIKQQTEAVQKALDEGNAAFKAGDLSLAITKYDEGFQANPDFVGSAPVLLNNKASMLRQRAVVTFNNANKLTDRAAKDAEFAKVQQDLTDAVDATAKSLEIIKTAPPADINDPKQVEASKFNSLSGAKEAFRLMSVTRMVDVSKGEQARTIIGEYMTIETDAAKKLEAQRIIGDIFLSAADYPDAVIEYKKALEMSPQDPDALAGMGLSLVVMGYESNDKAKFQEAADYLQKFIDVAPPNHKLLQSVKESIADLKETQKVAPTSGGKTTTTKKKP